jgi:lysozyme
MALTKKHGLIGVASAAAIALATPQVAKWEGLWLTVKPDKLAYGLPTGGYGETEGVKLGETHTKEFWQARLQMRLPQYAAKIAPCIKVELPDEVVASLISLSYNAGAGAVCRSSILAKMNAGDIKGGCEAIVPLDRNGKPNVKLDRYGRPLDGWYVSAGGKYRQGLANRRADERKLCEKGLK